MLILTKSTLRNPSILQTRTLPRKFFRRVMVLPRGATVGQWLRIVVENQFLRYMVTLLPFVGVVLVWEDAGLAVAHAPLPMVAAIMVVEMRVLRLSKKAREVLITPDEAARRLDLLGFRAKAILRSVAAQQGLAEGELHLVIEQSELARVAPLTLVTIQSDAPKPHVLDLDPAARAIVQERLFDADLSERALLEVNLMQGTFLRTIRVEARSVSAHARLAAVLEGAPVAGPDLQGAGT